MGQASRLFGECLTKLDKVIDPEHQKQVIERHKHALQRQPVDRLPLVLNVIVDDWPTFSIGEAFYDREKMLLQQLAPIYGSAQVGDDRIYGIRANYGVGILPSMFGLRSFIVADDQMPWTGHVETIEELQAILDAGVPDVRSGLGGKALDTEAYYHEMLAPYPNLAQTIRVYHCDLQGPLDATHIIWGSDLMTAFYLCPKMVHQMIELVTETYLHFYRAERPNLDLIDDGAFSAHWAAMIKGEIVIRQDSDTLISPMTYREFSLPYTERLLREVGAGALHYCGNGKQILPIAAEMAGLTGLNFGNPEMQDLMAVNALAAKRGLAIFGWSGEFGPEAAAQISTGITLQWPTPVTVEEGRALFQTYKEQGYLLKQDA